MANAHDDPQRKHKKDDESIVDKVKNADDLDEFEKRLLGTIIDPGKPVVLLPYPLATEAAVVQRPSIPLMPTCASNRTSSRRFAPSYRYRSSILRHTALVSLEGNRWREFFFTVRQFVIILPRWCVSSKEPLRVRERRCCAERWRKRVVRGCCRFKRAAFGRCGIRRTRS